MRTLLFQPRYHQESAPPKDVFLGAKQVEIARCEVRAVRWMLEDCPLELPQRHCSLIGTMRTGIVMQQHHPFSEEA